MIRETKIGQHSFVKIDTTGLDNLLTVAEKKYAVRVGILGNKAHAKHRMETGDLKKHGGHKIGNNASELTNAEIGLRHEKGVKSEHLPRRSWLVTPLEDHLPENLNKIGEETIEMIIKHQWLPAYQELGIICEQIIQRGFETGGFGKWKVLSKFTIQQKGSSAILIDTAQLRKSVTSTVVQK